MSRFYRLPLPATILAILPIALLAGCSQSGPSDTATRPSNAAIAAPVSRGEWVREGAVARSSGQILSKSNTCTEANPFDESVRFALKASSLAQTARTKEDWDEVARQWVQAVAWMQAVPPQSPKRAFAEKKVVEYMRNLTYSQQQATKTSSAAGFPSFESEPFDSQLQLYLSYLNTVGTPDVLIVGSSRALQGVDPNQMQRSLAAKGYGNLKIFNFGINGATAQVVDYLLKLVLPPDRLPRMIVWADGVRAFNSGRFDRTFAAILDSAGHRRLASGVRPQLAQNEVNPTTCYELPQPCDATGSKWKFMHTEEEMALQPANNVAPSGNFQDLIYRPEQQPIAARLASLNAIDANGFLPRSDRYNPYTYYQRRPYVPGQYDGDYRAFNLQGVQARAFDSVVAFTSARNIPLVFVNLPLTDDYLDSVRWSAERQFRDRMRYLSQQFGFLFIDLSEQALTQYNYFVDPSHLNRYGAQAVAQKLAANPSIPWPRRK
ncbi:hypothetical protein [Lyngbya sp. CCY1209]|uniref:hypothetical protein n=1 Tax=Lyngbya sp. CCY1209 TaxID=2886103 RepID=UPI002D20A3A7|nr:hypothetical protein [Lyngbya sp. CCY1209]MEB3886439.1 hypothetical protein [Lyngbya sp. CCY1209]